MKRLLIPCSVALLVLLAGCKKSNDAKSADSNPAAPSAATRTDSRPDEPATLKIQWPVGSRFTHRMEVEQTMNLPAPGAAKPVKQEVTMGQDYSLTVLRELDAGGREVEMEFQDVNMSVVMGGNEVLGFDTRGEASGDESNPAIRPLRLMVGQKLRFQIDASNRVEKVEGVKEFTEKVFSGGGGGRNPMASMFSEDYFKQMMSSGRDLPGGEVKPGATWPSRSEVILGPLGKASLDLTFTFKGWEERGRRRCARLEYTGTITGQPGETNSSSPFASFMSVTGGRSSGQSWFDPVRGLIIESAIRQDIRLQLKFPNRAGAGASDTPAETTLDQRISVKLTEESKK